MQSLTARAGEDPDLTCGFISWDDEPGTGDIRPLLTTAGSYYELLSPDLIVLMQEMLKPVRLKNWFRPRQEKWINFKTPKMQVRPGTRKGSGWRRCLGHHVLRIC